MIINKVNVLQEFAAIERPWSPKTIGRLNGQSVKIAIFKDEFIMHKHSDEDELFYVIEGTIYLQFEDHTQIITAGEFCIVPKDTLHKPYALEPAKVMLFEPDSTVRTGD